MNSAIFSKSAKGLILASGLIAASSVVGYAQDVTVALGAQATVPLSSLYASAPSGSASLGGHSFDLSGGNLVSLASGESVTYTGSWSNAQSALLLVRDGDHLPPPRSDAMLSADEGDDLLMIELPCAVAVEDLEPFVPRAAGGFLHRVIADRHERNYNGHGVAARRPPGQAA